MPALPWANPSREMQARVDELAQFLGSRGAKVAEAMPAIDIEEYFRDYLTLLIVESTAGQDREDRARAAQRFASDDSLLGAQALGYTLDAAGHIGLLRRREIAREAWRQFFTEWDVLIAPTALDAAFPHQEGDQDARLLQIDGDEVPYMMNILYPMWAIYAGLPATAFPAGLNRAGLPLGLQAIGPYLEDRTTMTFAGLIEREWRAFEPPPGY
jgi:amidase